MTHQINNIYIFDTNNDALNFHISQLGPNLAPSSNSNEPDPNTNSNNQIDQLPYWRPSPKLQRLFDRFQNTILKQYPRIACVYCGKLLYPEKASWTFYNPSITYPIQQHIPDIDITTSFNPNTDRTPEYRIPTCDSCKKPSTRFAFPHLSPISDEILSVPLHRRRHLSPVYLHCALGRNPNSNPYSEYRSLTGTMGYSRNIRAHALYSGTIGAILEPNNESNPNPTNNSTDHLTQDPILQRAATWLTQNNPYLRPFTNLLTNNQHNETFPRARHIPDEPNPPPFNTRDIVVPNYDLPDEIHNEDFHYTRLMAGFVQEADNLRIPISTYSSDLEPLLFPDLFTDGKGHFRDISNQSTNYETRDETYGKYIKLRLMNIDPRWRLHHHWPSWSYLQLEKLRHHQNTQRLLRQNQHNLNNRPNLPTAANLLRPSSYSSRNIIDESKTFPVPSFIRTGDTYFHRKQLHLNAMINKLGLPTLFITLSMAESRWSHLQNILANSDNRDTLPTNRPFHCTNYFVHRFQSLKKELYNKPELTGFGEITDFFDRVEFQNRGAAHTHSCYWTTNSIELMISKDIIRSTIPNPLYEPELYAAVIANQIHTCNHHCQGPAPPGQTCKKGFPRPYSQTTHYEEGNSRYIYKCLTQADSWVVPYHPAILLLWDAHMNIQYITNKGFAQYMSKYIVKTEPSHIFNIYENDLFRQHIIARRLSSMELMFLLLGHPICNSSTNVKFLTTEPPPTRTRTILPVHMIDEDDENPYYDDTITKYMSRPHSSEFDNLTYIQYFERYSISPSRPSNTSRQIYRDDLSNYVIKRSKEIIIRYRFLKIEDGELYFYQQLLLNVPTRSENNYKNNPNDTYREKFLSLFPDFLTNLQNQTSNTYQSQINHLNTQFSEVLNRLLQSLNQHLPTNIQHIIQIQMEDLKILPHIHPQSTMLELPHDQYHALSTISTYMGPNNGIKWPYYFITGSGGTGKSYIINLIINMLNRRSSNYLLLAPTGVAAQNIGGQTIHSALRISTSHESFRTRAYADKDLNDHLKKIDTIIFDEGSMISGELFDFISNTFANLHRNSIPFGGINIIVAGDLTQLPPITGQQIFRAATWPLFYPLFLREPQRQHSDINFYHMLQEIRMGTISTETWNTLQQRHSEFITRSPFHNLLNTTHIVGLRETAQQINRMVCNTLPVPDNRFLISKATDVIDSTQWDPSSSEQLFKPKTNLPLSVRLQPGARVMYLNNSLMDQGICNGTIGIITDVDPIKESVRVAFSIRGSIVDININKQTHYFQINGNNSHRTQFPIQNSFALTVHKTQGLTLPRVSLALDENIFSTGQAYVALSRCPTWENVDISHLDRSAFKTDQNVIIEYQRLEEISQRSPQRFL